MSQIGWPHLFPLAMGLRFGQEAAAAGIPIDTLADDAGAKDVLQAIVKVPAAGPFGSSPVVPASGAAALDAFLKSKGDAILEALAVGQLTPTCAQAVEMVRRSSGPICATCPALGADDKACQWTVESHAADLRVIARGGACLQPLTELFDFCQSLAATAYADACGTTPAQKVVLTTGSRHERNVELNLAFSANATESGQPDERVVHMSFYESSFSFDDYLALPYVLFHECFAHGFCGIPLDKGRPSDASMFQEGWMDCAAALVLGRALRTCSPSTPAAVRNAAAQASLRMLEVVRVRYDRTRANAPRDVTQWRKGQAAFDAFRELCRFALLPRLGAGAIEAAEQLALKFSIELNASAAFDAKARRSFVRAIYNELHRSDPQAQTRVVSSRAALLAALDSYSLTGGQHGLITVVGAAGAIP